MNACELTRLETALRAALRAIWRGEPCPDTETLTRQYVAIVGDARFIDVVDEELAAFKAEKSAQ